MTIPKYKLVKKSINSLFNLLFPETQLFADDEIETAIPKIQDNFRAILFDLSVSGDEIVRKLFNDLGNIKAVLLKDADYILESDPAATALIEVIALYPGFYALFCYRIAHYLIKFNVPLLPRMISEYAHRQTGIDIHPAAVIGSPIAIDHGTGIVIGGTTVIGNYVKIYQGVTLGALSVVKNEATSKRHPTIEDHVILYAGSTILGGETVVGNNSVIGGNVWLTESVAPFSTVYHKSDVIVKQRN